jgi:hypothetical protein
LLYYKLDTSNQESHLSLLLDVLLLVGLSLESLEEGTDIEGREKMKRRERRGIGIEKRIDTDQGQERERERERKEK